MFEHIDPAASLLAVLVVTYLVHSTIFLGSAWLVATLARLRSHALSERLWKSAAVLGLVTAPAQLLLGSMAFGVEIPLFTSIEAESTSVEESSTNYQARFDTSEKHIVMVRPRQSEANASLDVSKSIETEDSTAKPPVDHVVFATPISEKQLRDRTAHFPSEEPRFAESSVVISDSLRSGMQSEEQRVTGEIHSDSERLVTAASPLQTTSPTHKSLLASRRLPSPSFSLVR